MESLDTVNTERKAIIDTLKTEKALMEVLCDNKENELNDEVKAPAYYSLELVDMIKSFLEWNKTLRAIDQRVIKEMGEWISAVKKVVIGIESQENKLKQQEQLNDTLRKQINILKSKIEKQVTITPEFKESVKVIDEEIKEIEADRLIDEELEKGKHLFKVEGQTELICWYLYNKSETPMDIDKTLKFSPNTANSRIRENSQYFERVDKVGKKIVYTLSKEGKEYVEKIIKSKK